MMALLDNIKDENGKVKKPILYSAIAAAVIVGYMILKGKSTVTATGTSSALTPDLSALMDAIKNLGSGVGTTSPSSGGGGGGSGSSPSLDPPKVSASIPKGETPISAPTYTNTPSAPLLGGSSGASGGGGSGTGLILHPIAKTPTVYGGMATTLVNSGQDIALPGARSAQGSGLPIAPVAVAAKKVVPAIVSPTNPGQKTTITRLSPTVATTGSPTQQSSPLSVATKAGSTTPVRLPTTTKTTTTTTKPYVSVMAPVKSTITTPAPKPLAGAGHAPIPV